MTKYLNQWMMLKFGSKITRAQIVDVEFDSGLGPVFLFRSNSGNTFWLTKREITDHRVQSK